MVIAILAILGLAWGSFVNALVWRLHEQGKIKGKSSKTKKGSLESKDKQASALAKLSIVNGRSMCPNCRHELAAKDLIPIFSWLMLRGKCRYCHKSISWQYPLVEAITALIFVFCYVFWPLALGSALSIVVLALWLVMVIVLMALSIYDIKWQLLPNRLVATLSLVAVVQAVIVIATADSPLRSLLGHIIGAVIVGGLFYLILVLSKGKWIGGGDVKLGFVLGLIAAAPGQAVLLLFSASVLGSLVSLPLMAINKLKRSSTIPFGPFLILATLTVVLFGTQIIDWYLSLFLLR
ncbi:MAG: prepilin peptidase [Candidatus Saccharimonadales bacterium]